MGRDQERWNGRLLGCAEMTDFNEIVEWGRKDRSRFDDPHRHLEPREGDALSDDPWDRIVAARGPDYTRLKKLEELRQRRQHDTDGATSK